jgi:hypothetical protein
MKISIDIDAGKKTCDLCDMSAPRYMCRLFMLPMEPCANGLNLYRLPECLAAEVKAKKEKP